MALIVRKTVRVGGEDWHPGDVIPKEYEESPAHNFRTLLENDYVDRIPDEIVYSEDEDDSEGEVPESERTAAHRILSQNVADIKETVSDVEDVDFLDTLYEREKNHKERKTALKAIAERRQQLYEEVM